MRPKLILLLIVASGALASSAYIVIKSQEKPISCQKKCNDKKRPVTESSRDGDEILNASFNHLIVFTMQ